VVSSFSFAFVEYNFNVITGPVEEHSPPELFALVGITGNTGLFTTGIYGIVKVSFNSPRSHRNPLRCHSSSPRSSAPFSSSTAWAGKQLYSPGSVYRSSAPSTSQCTCRPPVISLDRRCRRVKSMRVLELSR